MSSPPASTNNYSLLTANEQPLTTHTKRFSDADTQCPLSDAIGGPSHTGISQMSSSGHTTSGKEPSVGGKAPLHPPETARIEPCDGLWGAKDQAKHKQLCDEPTVANCQEARQMEAKALQEILNLRVPATGMMAFLLLGMAARRSGAAAKHVLENIDQKTQSAFYDDVSLDFTQAVKKNLGLSTKIAEKGHRINRIVSPLAPSKESSEESRTIET